MFYTYMYLRDDGTPYYVGKGSGKRVFVVSARATKPPSDKMFILIEYHESEQDAFEAEKFLISFYGRKDIGTGCLRNHTDGGDGASNPSNETRIKISQGNKGKKLSPKIIENLRKINTGRVASEETRSKMSFAKLGKKRSDEFRRKESQSHIGIPWGDKRRFSYMFTKSLKESFKRWDTDGEYRKTIISLRGPSVDRGILETMEL